MFNRFSYVLNSPINFNDPTGHVCSDPDDPTPSCDGSMLHKTKVGNQMIQGGTMKGAKVKGKGGGNNGENDGDEYDNPLDKGKKCRGLCSSVNNADTADMVCPPNIGDCVPIYSGSMITAELNRLNINLVNLSASYAQWGTGLVIAGGILGGAGGATGNIPLAIIGGGLAAGGAYLVWESFDTNTLATQISSASSVASTTGGSVNIYVFQSEPDALPSFTFENSPSVFNSNSITTYFTLMNMEP